MWARLQNARQHGGDLGARLGGTQFDPGVGQLLLQLLNLLRRRRWPSWRPSLGPRLERYSGAAQGLFTQLVEALRADAQNDAGLFQT